MDLRRLLEHRYRLDPNANAILALGRRPISYARLFEHCTATNAVLNGAGVSGGDRVAVVLPNGPEMAACFLAVTMGQSCAPLNPTYRRSEFEFYLSDLAPRALIVQDNIESPAIAVAESQGILVIRLHPSTDQECGIFSLDFGRSIKAVVPVWSGDGDEALVLHTSGTTARPKMVPLTHANLTASAASIAASLGLDFFDRCLNVMPLFHIHGLVGALLATLAAGGSIVCTPGFQAPLFLDWCQEFKPTWYTAVPTMHQAVLARARQNGRTPANCNLRFIRSCSAALAPQLMAEMEQTFDVPVIEAYGMTEASHQIATNPQPPGTRKPGSVGISAGAEVAVMDEGCKLLEPGEIGEIVVRGAGVTVGYAQNPEANRTSFTNGWFRTGDQGMVDMDGYLFITGRLKEMINRGGEKISPREIDEVLSTHPAVAHAVAFAIPDRRLGEEIAAAVVLRPGHVASETEIRNHATQLIADYKVPHRIVFLDELPKGPTGKLQRIGMAALLGLDSPDGARQSPNRPTEFIEPRTPTERMLADIWRHVLRVERIGVDDDFLMLGGDSILAALVIARIREVGAPGISLLTFFEYPTLAGLAEAIDRTDSGRSPASDPIVAAAGGDAFPLSSAQRRMWFLTQLEDSSTAYNRCNVYRIRGPLDCSAVERALGEIVARHAVLRTTYKSPEGEPRQVISPSGAIALAQLDLNDEAQAHRMERALAAATKAANLQFDLARDPMLRPLLVKLDADDHLLVLTMHHIASDGWSAGVLMREFAALYAAFSDRQGFDIGRNVLEPLPIQYYDFATWQARSTEGVAAQESLEWWKKRLAAAPPLLALPIDRPRPPRQTFSGASESFVIPSAMSDSLKEIASSERATLFITLLAAFQIMLHRYTGTDDIVVGVPVAGRTRVETEALIGLFVNTLAMRGDLSGDPAFRELLRKTRDSAFQAYSHQDLPFDMVVESIHPQRNLSYPPIFQVTFQVRNYPLEDTQLTGLEVEEVDFDPGTSLFDLSFEVTEKAGSLFCKLIYNLDLFDRETISRMAGHFETLLGGIVNDPESPISRLPLLKPDERRQLLIEWNDTGRDYPRESVHRLFEAQVEKTPEAVAVVYEANEVSYGELNRRANQLAHYLRELGVGPEVMVGICMERSLEMVVGLLGILKAGGAYVPMDPTYPKDRLAYMAADARVPVLLTQHRLLNKLPELQARTVSLDAAWSEIAQKLAHNPASLAGPDNLAYVIYTSGSTGAPKGVMIPHQALANYLGFCIERYPVEEGCGSALFSSIAFDLTITSLFPALMRGKRVVVEGGDQIPSIPDDTFSLLKLTPAHLSLFAQGVALEKIATLARALVIGGEALYGSDIRFWQHHARQTRLINEYGPTETVVGCSTYEIVGEQEYAVVPIGKPIANTEIYILDRYQNPVPVGVAGELYVGGAGLARGYLGRPAQTAEKFIPDKFSGRAGGRLYRTGDLGRYLPDGNIEFIGRLDNQVKIRGYRIELGEVEAVLTQHPAVSAAVVAAWEDEAGNKRLIGYVVGADGVAPTVSQLRGYLKERLPEYMVPAEFVVLEAMPLTPNGKINRTQLPPPDPIAASDQRQFVEPRDDIERRLQTIWEKILNVRPIGVCHDFYELGGHSLLAAKVLATIQREFDFRVPLAAMFPAITIESLAVRIRGDGSHCVRNATVPIQPRGALPSLFVVGNFQVFRDLARYLGPDQPMIGLAVSDELRMRLPYKVEELAAYQVKSILKYQDAGPYFVAGFSAEGVLAYEVAQQLRAARREVGLLVMIDTTCPTQRPQPLFVRMAHNAGVHLREVRTAGVAHARVALLGIFRRAELRLRVYQWRIRNWMGGGSSKPLTPARPADLLTSTVLAARRYVARPYDRPVLLFKQTRDSTRRYRLKDYGWSEVVRGGLEVCEISGDHLALLAEPGVDALAEKLAAAMREARVRLADTDSSAAAL